MSKHYGRNQKRRHRQRIAELEETLANVKRAYTLDRSLLTHYRDRYEETLAKLRQVFECIDEALNFSMFLPPKEIEGGAKPDRLTIQTKPRNKTVYEYLGPVLTNDEVLRTVDVRALEVLVEEHAHKLDKFVHLIYRNGKSHTTYMISEEALCTIPKRLLLEGLVPKIAKELLELMRTNIRGDNKR